MAVISEAEATDLATRYITEQCRNVPGGVALVDKQTTRKSYGWVFFYNAKRYLETHSPLDSLGGNGPIIVLEDGQVHQLGSALDPEVSIAEFERAQGIEST